MSAMRRALPLKHPVLIDHELSRAKSAQNRVADMITAFAGSMTFVYLHLIWFAAWIIFRLEAYPYGLLTMIVSLEAIFLSTFVMISQNRADISASCSPISNGRQFRLRKSRMKTC